MNPQLDQYIATHADWRKTLRQNHSRTYIIIVLFILIYSGIGVLVDLYMASATYTHATISQLFVALIHLQIFPIATLIMFIVACIALWVSYAFYDKLMLLGTEYHEITPESAQSLQEKQLYNVVEEMKVAAGLKFMPKVYIIDADYMNAFASGYSEKSAMVAITRGLMQKLNRDELQAVMAHEISHIRHLDIKLTLTASLLANMTVMILDMFFYNIVFSRRDEENNSRNSLAGIIMLLRYILPVISMVLLLYLSRTRELMADAGCVQLMRTNEPLASALLKIQNDYATNKDQYNAEAQATSHENLRREAYIFDPEAAGVKFIGSLNDLFSTHPSLEERLRALGFKLRNK